MIDLGKWPTMRVVGERISPSMAGDILICTYPWFSIFPQGEGWEHEARLIAAEYGMPLQPVREHGGDHGAWMHEVWQVWKPAFDQWSEQYGLIDAYSEDGPVNNLISTTYRSWCTWDGLVAGQFNIGKWLDPESDVLEFFDSVAMRWPNLSMVVDLVSEHEDCRWVSPGDSNDQGYNQAARITVRDGHAALTEGPVEPLVLPEEFERWQNNADRMSDQGVTPGRLHQAFAHLTR